MEAKVGQQWKEKDNRFVRIVEIVGELDTQWLVRTLSFAVGGADYGRSRKPTKVSKVRFAKAFTFVK